MREQIGTVEILTRRLYPRYPDKSTPDITTETPLVEVDAGKWPVYRSDDGVIFWEMEGELVKLEPTLRSLGDGMFESRVTPQRQGSRVIFSSLTFTDEEFAEFRASNPLVAGDNDVRRLVFEVVL
jgi:hypothetical protein